MSTEKDKNEALNKTDVSSSINSLLSKFDNGLELYQNNAVFANCIEHLLRGGDVYKILEQIIVMQQNQQKHFEEIINSGKIRQEIIVSKGRFDGLLEKCEHKNIKRENVLDEFLDWWYK